MERAWGNATVIGYFYVLPDEPTAELLSAVTCVTPSIRRRSILHTDCGIYTSSTLCVTARLPRLSHSRAGCVCAGRGRRLRLLELSLRRWRARVRALAMSSSSPYAMAARRASRSCTAVVADYKVCSAADEACAVKMVL